MKTEFGKAYFLTHKGCYSSEQVESIYPPQKETVTLAELLESDMPLADKFWFVIKMCELTNRQKQELVAGVADIVLELYENEYPTIQAPRESIEAMKQYLSGAIALSELISKRNKSKIFVSIALNDFNQGIIKQPIAKDAILAVDVALKNTDVQELPFADQTEYINNAGYIATDSAVKSAITFDASIKENSESEARPGQVLFQDLLLDFLKEFIAST